MNSKPPSPLRQTLSRPVRVALVLTPGPAACFPPLSLAALRAVLSRAGAEVRLFDFNVAFWRAQPEIHARLLARHLRGSVDAESRVALTADARRWAEQVAAFEPELIGYSTVDQNVYSTQLLAGRLRDLGVLQVVGGPAVTTASREELLPRSGAIELAVEGEGEQTALEVAGAVARGASTQGLPGTLWRDAGGSFHSGPAREPLASLDALPVPDYADLEITDYQDPMLPLEASRGCVCRCKFCGEFSRWQRFRHKSADTMLEEITAVAERYPGRLVTYVDSLLNGHLPTLLEFCERLIEAELNVSWSGRLRADRRLTDERAALLARAGMIEASFGVESGSAKVLSAMGKGVTPRVNAETLRVLTGAGIRTCTTWIVGYPGEGEAEFQETLDFIEVNHQNIWNVAPNALRMQADTAVWAEAHEQGCALPDDGALWTSADGANTLEVRRDRMLRLSEAALHHGIRVVPLQELGWDAVPPEDPARDGKRLWSMMREMNAALMELDRQMAFRLTEWRSALVASDRHRRSEEALRHEARGYRDWGARLQAELERVFNLANRRRGRLAEAEHEAEGLRAWIAELEAQLADERELLHAAMEEREVLEGEAAGLRPALAAERRALAERDRELAEARAELEQARFSLRSWQEEYRRLEDALRELAGRGGPLRRLTRMGDALPARLAALIGRRGSGGVDGA